MVKEWEEKERDLDYTGVSKVQIMSYFKKKKKKGFFERESGQEEGVAEGERIPEADSC